ncbi:uncharacterized protein PV09_01420 [Verruconis gallopava]|uniref:Uncharacterized protein n=1 Tax=Verruconis gallopava TaxID=253628 RepID=A0A0D1Y0H6_9PEZI|nr:uncharacterized protein PV09_01420 [Verruconis gallopava]KIW08531.1 hypothetical protein PV09_01420 [Verruconis gallopava]
METRPVKLVLFGDQAVEKLTSIQSLVRFSKTSPYARRFLQEANDLVQLLLYQLSEEDRAWKYEVGTLLSMAEDNTASTEPNAVIATVLMCIGRLGDLIVHAEEDASILGSHDNQVQVLAFCTGLLPAAALIAACDTNDLFELGKEIISITFRMSLAIQQRLTIIEDSNASWATTLVCKTPERVQHILDDFHHSKNTPYAKRIAVSVISTDWLTISGAPSSLRDLMEYSTELKNCPKIETDTKAAHTPYLPPLDMNSILGDSPLLDKPITSKARILSPSSCRPYTEKNLRSLLSEMIVDIVSRTLRIDETINSCISAFKNRSISLTVAGPTAHLPAVERMLKSQNIVYEFNRHRNLVDISSSRSGSGLVAVVGMAARLPGSEDVDTFFENLMEGKIELQKIPQSRFEIDRYYDSDGKSKNSTATNQGTFLERPGYFDNRFFSISPREALQMDPLQRMLLTTSWEALEIAGYSRNSTLSTQNSRIAIYFGQAANDWNDVLNSDDIDIYYVPSLSRAFGPGRLAYHHKWGGGTYSIDAACATSTTAIHVACQALCSRECDMALAGGGSLCVSPMTFAGLSKSGMISNRGGCRTYHDDADGYARGEGVGVVVLKRLEDATAENDNILGVIRGHARTYTTTSSSITHPSAEAQAHLYKEILRQTAMDPNEIAYVEMHGTGTQAGDLEEMKSVIQVLGQHRTKQNILTVGAVKANVGHGEGAAGVTALIKVLMMIKERKIPPQPGIPFKINRHFPDLDALHIRIAGFGGNDNILRPSPVSRNGKITCLLSSFDASGGNTALIIEEGPGYSVKTEHPVKFHVVTLSAKSGLSLQRNQQRLLDFLTRHPETALADLSYTTTARRIHHPLRAAYTGHSTREILTSLREDLSRDTKLSSKKFKSPNVIFAFTGQGSQYAGMGRYLFNHCIAYRKMLQTFQEMSVHQGLPQFLHLLSDTRANITESSIVSVQIAIVALEIATAKLLKSWGIYPQIVIGHSLGEYSALCVAGVLSVSDTLYLVGRRARMMEERLVSGEYGMLAVAKGVEAVMQLLNIERNSLLRTQIACVNTPNSTVVSGPLIEVQHLKDLLEQKGSKSTFLRTPYGFHSGQMSTILEEYEVVTKSVTFCAPVLPIASTLFGRIVQAGEQQIFNSNYLIRQTRDSVNFISAVHAIQTYIQTEAAWIDIGPEPIAVNLARNILTSNSNHFLYTMKQNEDNWESISNTLASLYRLGVHINWPCFHRPFLGSLSLVKIPTYAFDEKQYWKQYAERYHSGQTISSEDENVLKRKSRQCTAPPFRTTSLHNVEDEIVNEQSISVTFTSHTSEKDLNEAIQGHVVNGVAIMSMSIFCDMAKSATYYAYKKVHPDREVPIMNIHELKMTNALVLLNSNSQQIVKTTVTYSGESAHVSFSSTAKGARSQDHGNLRISFQDFNTWPLQQKQMQFLVDARLEHLKEMSNKGSAHRLMKPVIYKLFGNLVNYSTSYRALEEVWMDNECRDAAGIIKLADVPGTGKFLYNPFWSDGAIHIAGFLLNSGLKYDENTAFLCIGLESWALAEELRSNELYTTYTVMQDGGVPNMITGSVFVYDSKQKLVQIATGIQFQKMNRTTLDALLKLHSSPGQPLVTVDSRTTMQPEKLENKIRLDALMPIPSQHGSQWDVAHKDSGYATPDSQNRSSLMKTFIEIVSSECGCRESDLEPGTLFSDIGVDSLMAITIIAAFRKQTAIELPITFFIENKTISEASRVLSGQSTDSFPQPPSETQQSGLTSNINLASTVTVTNVVKNDIYRDSIEAGVPMQSLEVFNTIPQPNEVKVETKQVVKQSQVLLLHGSPSSSGPKLFLLPDGTGSPSCYIGLPSISPSINVYAVKSPYVRCPAEFTCDVRFICESFLSAIRSVQPNGPYLLGGFSFGALYAYELTRILIEQGEVIDCLFILDMAVPTTIKTPSVTGQLVAEAGLLPPTGVTSAAQKEHIVNTVRAMVAYRPTPYISASKLKKTILISSEEPLAAGKNFELSTWARGSDSTYRGWENLIQGSIECKVVSTTHFGLLKYPNINTLRDIWVETLTSM